MNAICKPCKRVYYMRRLLKRHRCPECKGELHAALLLQRSETSPDGRTWFCLRGNGGYKVGVVTKTRLV